MAQSASYSAFGERIHSPKPVNILMVEDNPADSFLTVEILSESERNSYRTNIVRDGAEALLYLHKRNGYEKALRPDLILLDLNLPRLHGFDFLAKIKKEPELKDIPVCIFTTSEAQEDIKKAKELNADCYFVKPLNLSEFESEISGIVPDLFQ
jgi:chemotaxis family two-component system response regulator Rcp1